MNPFKDIIDNITKNKKCCCICMDNDDLILVKFIDTDNIKQKKIFCNDCYNIQINMN